MTPKTIRDNTRLLVAQLRRRRERLLRGTKPLGAKAAKELSRIEIQLLKLGEKL